MKRYLCDGIVKGATHQRNGLPCQDSKKIVEISDDIVIMAVADGHGSEKCPRSDRGSTIAVNTFCEVMKNYLQNKSKFLYNTTILIKNSNIYSNCPYFSISLLLHTLHYTNLLQTF